MGPSGAAIWSAPTFDAATKTIYATTGDNYSDPPTETSDAILAFNVDLRRVDVVASDNLGRRIQYSLQSARKRELSKSQRTRL